MKKTESVFNTFIRVLVIGSRNWRYRQPIERALTAERKKAKVHGFKDIIVIHGGARGADSLAEDVCTTEGIATCIMPARWYAFGKAAGPIRNAAMLSLEPSVVLVFHKDISKSKGTKNFLDQARKNGKPGLRIRVIGGTNDISS